MRERDHTRGAQRDSHRTAILSILEEADQPLHVEELADRLVKQDETMMQADAFADSVERTLLSLHHTVLPRLADDGVITYDHESNMVSSVDGQWVDVDWFDGESLGAVLADLDRDGSPDTDSIGVIRGRQSVIEYGRRLADVAEEELFCLYVRPDLLEDECVRRAEAAIDRGVELYMGSRDPAVRDLTRTHLPEATIWEPHRGWLDSPVGYPKVGRLVLADRENVMLAILDAPDPDGEAPEEKALVGAGEENPLVVLVRDLLGPRIDHLDLQSTDFHSKLECYQ